MMISLAEYAARNGKRDATARQMALRGGFETAQKIGRNWVIDEREPWPDRRFKNGQYQNWRDESKISGTEHLIRDAITMNYGYDFLRCAEETNPQFFKKAISGAAARFDAHESADMACYTIADEENSSSWKGDEEELKVAAEGLAPQFAEIIFGQFCKGLTRDQVLTMVNPAMKFGLDITINIAVGINRSSLGLVVVWNNQHPNEEIIRNSEGLFE